MKNKSIFALRQIYRKNEIVVFGTSPLSPLIFIFYLIYFLLFNQLLFFSDKKILSH